MVWGGVRHHRSVVRDWSGLDPALAIPNAGDRDGATVIEVADSGPGIAAGEREAVFRRFHRADRSRGTDGNGPGLALVRAIADLHGFTVSVADATPGCTMRLTAPAARGHARTRRASRRCDMRFEPGGTSMRNILMDAWVGVIPSVGLAQSPLPTIAADQFPRLPA